jgi:hypothetical protein
MVGNNGKRKQYETKNSDSHCGHCCVVSTTLVNDWKLSPLYYLGKNGSCYMDHGHEELLIYIDGKIMVSC